MDTLSRHNVKRIGAHVKVKLLVLLNGAVKENKLTLCIRAPIYEGICSLLKNLAVHKDGSEIPTLPIKIHAQEVATDYIK